MSGFIFLFVYIREGMWNRKGIVEQKVELKLIYWEFRLFLGMDFMLILIIGRLIWKVDFLLSGN